MDIISVNPATGRMLKNYPSLNEEQVDRRIKQTHRAFLKWRLQSFAHRASLMRKAAGILRKNKQDLARLMALEMGKPVAQGISEVEKCAWALEFYATETAGFLRPQPVQTDASKSQVVFEPLGVVLAVMPWNFPFWQVFRFAAPALMAGNAAVLKHASNVPGCALAIEKIFEEAGFPPHIFSTLLIPSAATANVISHPLISAVTLTGSTIAGKSVAAQAGSLLKKTVLELGGSDAYLILADADIKKAAAICVNSRLINNGESCIAAKRFIVVREVRAAFERNLFP